MEGFNKEQKSDSSWHGSREQGTVEEHGEVGTAEEFLSHIDDADRERIDYALNYIGETEKSLFLADDQEKVIVALQKIMQQEKLSDAARVAKAELDPLL